MRMKIRKIVTFIEETRLEMGRPVDPPTRRAATVAVIENPLAGIFEEDLSELMSMGEALGNLLSERTLLALGVPPSAVESYGKAAAVGENGELEHAAALLHPKFGAPVRKLLGKGAAIIPSSKKRGGPGLALDIPLGHKDA
ncbi:MAG: amino acid synthesis family protein, partial [Acidobacteria bacterium]|nr:amino acid synthesis family protein [Acidobacteriota bacterium]